MDRWDIFCFGFFFGVIFLCLITHFYPTSFYSVQKQFIDSGCGHYDQKTGDFVIGVK